MINFIVCIINFYCDCLNGKFVRMMVHIETIIGTLRRIIGKILRIAEENNRQRKKKAYLARILPSVLTPGILILV